VSGGIGIVDHAVDQPPVERGRRIELLAEQQQLGARRGPISAGRRIDDPASGTRPRSTNGTLNRALGAA